MGNWGYNPYKWSYNPTCKPTLDVEKKPWDPDVNSQEHWGVAGN